MLDKMKNNKFSLSNIEKLQCLFFKNCSGLYGASTMQPQYIGEHNKYTKYLSIVEKEQAKIKLINGLFYDNNNQLVNTINPKESGRYATSSLYVIDRDFNFYVFGNKFSDGFSIHHSSILSGRPVICAGYLTIIQGKLKSLSNESGHYQPTDSALFKVIYYLKKQQVVWKEYEIRYQGQRSLRPILYHTAFDFIKNHPYPNTIESEFSSLKDRLSTLRRG
jgi:hypothetical protein